MGTYVTVLGQLRVSLTAAGHANVGQEEKMVSILPG